jgi:tetratricopeptide (TPR) repeat protein
MKLIQKSVLLLWTAFCLNINFAEAARLHSVKGIVITPDGTVVSSFALSVKHVADKPELVHRRHYKNGEFTVEGLKPGKYQIEISSPLHIPLRMDFNFKSDDRPTDYSIVVLHPYRIEPRFIPAYRVSVKALQQKVPDKARDAYLKAVQLHRDGELEQALIEYGKAVRFYPQYLQALTDLSTIFILFNRPESALVFLHRAREIDDSNPIVNLNIAIAMTEQGEYSTAMKLFRKVIKEEPRMTLAHYYIAKTHYLQRKYADAEQAARQVVTTDPSELEAWILLVKINEELKDYVGVRDALMHLRDALSNKTATTFIEEQLSSMKTVATTELR